MYMSWPGVHGHNFSLQCYNIQYRSRITLHTQRSQFEDATEKIKQLLWRFPCNFLIVCVVCVKWFSIGTVQLCTDQWKNDLDGLASKGFAISYIIAVDNRFVFRYMDPKQVSHWLIWSLTEIMKYHWDLILYMASTVILVKYLYFLLQQVDILNSFKCFILSHLVIVKHFKLYNIIYLLPM